MNTPRVSHKSSTSFIKLLLLVPAIATHAEVLLTEEFAYPDGPLVEVAAGAWVTQSGTPGQMEVVGNAVRLTQAESEDANLPFPAGPFPADGDTVLYAAFQVTFSVLPSGGGTYFANFKDGATGFRARVFASTSGASEGRFRVGISEAASTAAFLETDLDLGQAYTLVCRCEVRTANATLWLDPTSESDPGISATDDGSAIAIRAFSLRQSSSSGDGMGELILDDLRVATSFAELYAPVSDAPAIRHQPQHLTVANGGSATFTVQATGLEPLGYQWFHDLSEVSAAKSPALTLTPVTEADAGSYYVVVSNDAGWVTSEPATLTVTVPLAEPPTILFTNVLEHLARPGDQLTNTFAEHGLRSGERLTLHVLITAPADHPVTVQADTSDLPASARWELEANPGTAVTGTFTMEPTLTDEGGFFDITIEAANDVAATNAAWRIYVPTADEQRVAITEYLANPTSDAEAPHFNPLQRATPSDNPGQQDEYLELVNLSSVDLDLDGWSLADAVQVRHRFTAASTLLSSNALIVFGGPRDGLSPGLEVVTEPASEGTAGLALNNTGDLLVLRNAAGGVVDRVVYGPSMISSQGAMTRHPTLDSGFVPQVSVATAALTPGRQYDGRPWSESAPLSSGEIGPVGCRTNPEGTLTLLWPVEAGQTYSLLSAPAATGPWSSLISGLTVGEFTEPFDRAARECFYRVSSP